MMKKAKLTNTRNFRARCATLNSRRADPATFYRAITLAFALLLASCSKPETNAPGANAAAPKSPSAAPVELARVEPDDLNERVSASGVFEANSELNISFKTGGLIRKVWVEAGQRVRAGTLLAELDLTELGAAQQASSENLRKAQRDFARAEQLYAAEVIAKAQLDDARTALQLATAGLRGSSFNADRGRIKAQFDGVVLRKFVESGEVVSAGQPVLSVAQQTGASIFRLALTDRDALRVNSGDLASVSFNALPEVEFRARVRSQIGGANPATGLFELELELAADPQLRRLSSGMSGRAQIELNSAANDAQNPGAGTRTGPRTGSNENQSNGTAPRPALAKVPALALINIAGERAQIYRFQAQPASTASARRLGKVQLVSIEISGPRNDGWVSVRNGLEIGEQIVTRGAAYLEDGQLVREANPEQRALDQLAALNSATAAPEGAP